MFGESTPEVLIIGAGPVGQFAALALARRGLRVRIVDRGLWPCAQSYALALHPRSLELLREVGLLDSVLASATLVHSLKLFDDSRQRAKVLLDAEGGPLGAIAVLRQDALEGLLEAALKICGVKVEWRSEVSRLAPDHDRVGVTIDKFEKESRGYVVAHTEWVVAKSTELQVPYVIGADGYDSRVRRAAHLDFHETGPAQYFAVFEFKSDASQYQDMRVVLREQDINVLWPLPDGYCRWSFELPEYQDVEIEDRKEGLLAAGFDFPTERSKERLYRTGAKESPILAESNLRRFIEQRAPWFTGDIGEVAWKSIVRFERRLASGFGKGRMWLAGDAAHLTGPVGIQSMNLGLAEAYELGNTLDRILRDAKPPAELEAYSQRWMGTWRDLHGLGSGLRAGAETEAWISRSAGRLTSCLPGYDDSLRRMAAQLGLHTTRAAGV